MDRPMTPPPTALKQLASKLDEALSRRRFLQASASAGAIASLSAVAGQAYGQAPAEIHNTRGHRKAIIIGSGFGGAISALRLTQAKVETLMLERGRRWPVTPEHNTFSPYIYPDGRSTWLANFTSVPIGPALPINKYIGVLEGQHLGGLTVMAGAAYGGGSITYGGLHVKPKKELLDSVFPAEVTYDDLQPYYDRFEQEVGISAAPDDVYQSSSYLHYRVVEAQNKRSGLTTEHIRSATDWDIVRQEIAGEIPPSAIHGEAIYGINSGAKKSLDKTYLRAAEATGFLEVKTQHQVTDIAITADGKYQVNADIIDEVGCVMEKVTYTCDYLFLSAGTLGTNALLVKAQAKGYLPKLNSETGAGFGNNGNVYVLRTEIGQETGQWQGGPPAVGIQNFDNPISPLFIEHPQFPLGLDLSSLMFFGVGINPTRGRFFYDKLFDRVDLYWPKRGNQQEVVNQAMLHTMRKLNADNGGIINTLLFGKEYKDDSVYHPLGGMVMGKACDFFGRVKNYDRLYVMDASLLPGSTACCNPSFTISAVIERSIERVIAEDFKA